MSKFIKWLFVVTVTLSVALVGALSLTACRQNIGNGSQTESPSNTESPSDDKSSSGGQSTGGEESSSGGSESSGGEESSSGGSSESSGSDEPPEPKTFTVIFDTNLGETVALDGSAPQSVTENEGGTIILPILKSLNYMEFKGWRVKNTSKLLNGEYVVEKNVTLVAVWDDPYTGNY